MAQSSSSSGSVGPDFHLPDEILSVMPTDPYDQLDLARKITSMAITSHVSKLKSEVGQMRQKLFEKDGFIGELEEKVFDLERANREKESQLRIAINENTRMRKDENAVRETAKQGKAYENAVWESEKARMLKGKRQSRGCEKEESMDVLSTLEILMKML